MSDDLQILLDQLEFRTAYHKGEIDERTYYKTLAPRVIAGENSTGALIVPPPMGRDLWLSDIDDDECAAHNREALAAMYNPKDKPRPPAPTFTPEQRPAKQSFTTRLKSLAGRKLLR